MTETKDMTLNEIATIRNILVGKEMGDLEGDLAKLKSQLSLDLEDIRTAIDNVNQKIEQLRQQTEERFSALEQLLTTSNQDLGQAISTLERKNNEQLSNAFLQLSNAFAEKNES
ncbi:MAG: hypothetical protein AAF847_17670 [Bacteroidota bacterium]